MRQKKIWSYLLIVALFMTSICFSYADSEVLDEADVYPVLVDNIQDFEDSWEAQNEDHNAGAKQRVIIELNDAPVIRSYRSVQEYKDAEEGPKLLKETALLRNQSILESRLKNKSVEIETLDHFVVAMNGISAIVDSDSIEAIKKDSQVKNVYVSKTYQRPETKDEAGEDTIQKFALGTDTAYRGEGMVIAIIDTGLDAMHRDMKLSPETERAISQEDIAADPELKGAYFTDKVPYGYNYFDSDLKVKDENPSSRNHGMHVAGIAAANGNMEGMAPEAQLLALKVFSNNPLIGYTYEDLYISAIEDAVRVGTNVVNMSLGLTSGFEIADSPMEKVIKMAKEKGVVIAVAGGNEAHSTSGYKDKNVLYRPYIKNPDIGLVAEPAVYDDVLAVGSFNAEYKREAAFSFLDKEKVKRQARFQLAGSTGLPEAFYEEQQFVYCGKGSAEDFPSSVKNHIALVERGDNTFVEKITNAEKSGAIGIMVFNDEANGETLASMEYPQGAKIPALSIGRSAGLAMLETMKQGAVQELLPNLSLLSIPKASEKVKAYNKALLPSSLDELEKSKLNGADIVLKINHQFISVLDRSRYEQDILDLDYYSNSVSESDNLQSTMGGPVSFNKEFIYTENTKANEISEFSSWGAPSSLELKPEITAFGGNVYSTLQDNLYGIKSGTSMATPNVAGASALVVQALKERNIAPENRVDLTKKLLMNTAEIVNDPKGIPYSPRRQGAGLMNVSAALKTPVIAEDAATGKAGVELKDFLTKTISFKVQLTNMGEEAATYGISSVALKDAIEGAYLTLSSEILDGAVEATDGTSVTVPGKGSKTVEFTLTVPEGLIENSFVEGFVRFVPETEALAEISVPFLGFYGSWAGEDAPDMIDGFSKFEEESYFQYAGLVNEKGEYLGKSPKFGYANSKERIAISPKDGSTEEGINAVFSLLRNAESVKVSILNENKQVVQEVATKEFLAKQYLDPNSTKGWYTFLPAFRWDGKVDGQVAEDGLYYYQIAAKMQYPGSQWQIKTYQFFVDTNGPVLNDLAYEKASGKLSWKASDNTLPSDRGILGFKILVNGKLLYGSDIVIGNEASEDYSFSLKALKLTKGTITVTAIDYAGNETSQSITIEESVAEQGNQQEQAEITELETVPKEEVKIPVEPELEEPKLEEEIVEAPESGTENPAPSEEEKQEDFME